MTTADRAVKALMSRAVKFDADGKPLAYAFDRADAEFIVETLNDAGFHLVQPTDGEPHVIEFRDDGWTIKHTLSERLDGDAIFDCDLSRWTGGDPGVRGRFVLVDDSTIGEEVPR